jgi:anaerobic magnesium-protoporphyrin IX monomethyl ester cyclase
MKKLALVNAGRNIEDAVAEPLNLESIASYVGKFNIDVKIIDEIAGQNVRREVLRYKPDIVGITGVTPLIRWTYQIADMCRSMGIRTVIGGVHASILPQEALEHCDIVVTGEGEIAMKNIIEQDIKSGIVKGITLDNLDDVPMLDRSKVEFDFYMRLPETYLVAVPKGIKTGAIFSSRGCSNNCAFCHNSWKDLPYRCNSVKRVMDEIHSLTEKYHVKAIYFMDDNLFMNKPRLHYLCHQIIESKLNIIWIASSRADSVDETTLKLAREAGCRQILFGFESGSQRMLDILCKKTTVEQNAKAIRMCHDAEILATGSFMIGNPTEMVEDIRMTQQFIRDNKIDAGGVNITMPFPGTQIWDWAREKNLIPEHQDWSKFVYSGITKGVLVCDTISITELEALYHETIALLESTKKRIGLRWFINLAIAHPIKSATIMSRSWQSWTKYAHRVKVRN